MTGDVVESVRVTRNLPLVAYRVYAINVNIQKNALNTSLRSAAHATDSTCNGCQANNAATNVLRHIVPVSCLNQRNSSKVLAT